MSASLQDKNGVEWELERVLNFLEKMRTIPSRIKDMLRSEAYTK